MNQNMPKKLLGVQSCQSRELTLVQDPDAGSFSVGHIKQGDELGDDTWGQRVADLSPCDTCSPDDLLMGQCVSPPVSVLLLLWVSGEGIASSGGLECSISSWAWFF